MSEMISVASGFQYSVNIGYDLHNEDKLKNFIPTQSALRLLLYWLVIQIIGILDFRYQGIRIKGVFSYVGKIPHPGNLPFCKGHFL